jgi:TonB family protein
MKDVTLTLLLLLCSLATTAQQSGQSAPLAVFAPEPEYSATAREAKVQGTCLLSLVVGQDGHSHDIQVARSLDPTLDEKAVEAVKNWTFKPAMKDGRPVAVRITVEVNFHIDPLLRSDLLRDEIGDLGIRSDLIAYNHDALEILKQKGPRKYYELTLDKGAQPLSVSSVTLQLKSSDPKHGLCSLIVVADQKTIRKKNRTVREPIQFYSGGVLYELVIWNVDRDKVAGYLSTPKNAP